MMTVMAAWCAGDDDGSVGEGVWRGKRMKQGERVMEGDSIFFVH